MKTTQATTSESTELDELKLVSLDGLDDTKTAEHLNAVLDVIEGTSGDVRRAAKDYAVDVRFALNSKVDIEADSLGKYIDDTYSRAHELLS